MYHRLSCPKVSSQLPIPPWHILTPCLSYYTICVWRLSKGKLYLVIPVVRLTFSRATGRSRLILSFPQAAMVFTEFGLSLAYTIIAYVPVDNATSRLFALTLVTSASRASRRSATSSRLRYG